MHIVLSSAVISGALVVLTPAWTLAEPPPRTTATESNHARDLILVGRVTKIRSFVPADELSQKRWAITVKVKQVVAGTFAEPTFTFAVHSPSMSGLEVGKSYTIKATWTDDGYVVDELQWRRP
jgi:hypothetical protein